MSSAGTASTPPQNMTTPSAPTANTSYTTSTTTNSIATTLPSADQLPPSAKDCAKTSDITFTELSSGVFLAKDNNGSTINDSNSISDCVLVPTFYKSHANSFDFLYIMSDATIGGAEEALGLNSPVSNIPGIPSGSLQSIINVFANDGYVAAQSSDQQNVLLHETGHNWLVPFDMGRDRHGDGE